MIAKWGSIILTGTRVCFQKEVENTQKSARWWKSSLRPPDRARRAQDQSKSWVFLPCPPHRALPGCIGPRDGGYRGRTFCWPSGLWFSSVSFFPLFLPFKKISVVPYFSVSPISAVVTTRGKLSSPCTWTMDSTLYLCEVLTSACTYNPHRVRAWLFCGCPGNRYGVVGFSVHSTVTSPHSLKQRLWLPGWLWDTVQCVCVVSWMDRLSVPCIRFRNAFH